MNIKPSYSTLSLEEEASNSPFYSNDNIQNFLEKDIINVKKETWSRLDKTTKLKKLRQYFEKVTEVGTWTDEEAKNTYEYLRSCFDRKRPHPNRIIKYDILTGIVISIKSSTPGTKTAKATKSSFISSTSAPASFSVSSMLSSHMSLCETSTLHVDICEVDTKTKEDATADKVVTTKKTKKNAGSSAFIKKTLKQSRSVLNSGGELESPNRI